jgi:hypothetical protein
MRIGYCGIRFFYVHVLARDWHILSILRAQNEHRLPAVLSVEEVRSILAQVKNFPHHVFLSTVYSWGLRLDGPSMLWNSSLPVPSTADRRRFLQHVLPTGFMKIRYYGFMNPNCAVPLERIRGLIELSYGFALDLPLPEVEPRRQSTCPSCAGLLKLRSLLPRLKILRRSG